MNYTAFLDGGGCQCSQNTACEQQMHTTDSNPVPFGVQHKDQASDESCFG